MIDVPLKEVYKQVLISPENIEIIEGKEFGHFEP